MQGGTISPTVANIVLDGMETLVKSITRESDKVNFVRYADGTPVQA
jgi:RNA-directed DNA polymerase